MEGHGGSSSGWIIEKGTVKDPPARAGGYFLIYKLDLAPSPTLTYMIKTLDALFRPKRHIFSLARRTLINVFSADLHSLNNLPAILTVKNNSDSYRLFYFIIHHKSVLII